MCDKKPPSQQFAHFFLFNFDDVAANQMTLFCKLCNIHIVILQYNAFKRHNECVMQTFCCYCCCCCYITNLQSQQHKVCDGHSLTFILHIYLYVTRFNVFRLHVRMVYIEIFSFHAAGKKHLIKNQHTTIHLVSPSEGLRFFF